MKRRGHIAGGAVALSLAVATAVAPATGAQAAGHDDGPSQKSRFTGPGFRAPRTPVRPDGQRYRDVGGWDRSPTVDARVNDLLGRMTTEEKADLATGELNNNYGFYNNPIERLGIPALTMADGPVGVRVANPGVDQQSTQL